MVENKRKIKNPRTAISRFNLCKRFMKVAVLRFELSIINKFDSFALNVISVKITTFNDFLLNFLKLVTKQVIRFQMI